MLDRRAKCQPMDYIENQVRAAYIYGRPEWVDKFDWEMECETLIRLFYAYTSHWLSDGAEIISTEEVFNLPIRNPKTGRSLKKKRRYRVSGKKDKVVRLRDGRIALREHKTTSDSIDIDSDYWKRVEMDHQITLYYWATQQAGVDVQTVEYDVIRKPGIRPQRATPEDKRKYKADGTLYANQRDTDETPESWGNRLAKDIKSRPDYYFRRMEFPRMRSDVNEFLQEMYDQSKAIGQGWNFRNTAACTMPYRCEYLDVCHNGLNLGMLPQGFVQVENIHQELEDENDSKATTS